MKKIIVLLIILFIFVIIFIGFRFFKKSNKIMANFQKVEFQTEDNVTIIGNYFVGVRANVPAVLLLHMMPATKESWNDFAEKLQKAGFQALAIDLRGHGESIKQNGKTLNYQKFSDQDHQNSILDVEAAVLWLAQKGKVESIVGASIGANLALQFQSEHPEIKKSVLLSPGLDYRGVKTETPAANLKVNQAVFFAATDGDARSSEFSAAQMSQRLYDLIRAQKEIKIFNGTEHGTDVFKSQPQLMDETINWLKN